MKTVSGTIVCGVLGGRSTVSEKREEEDSLDVPRDLKITRIVSFDLTSRRPRLVGKNSHLGVHGDRSTDRMVRLFTNAGIEGIGNCRADEKALAGLLGANPFSHYQPEGRRMTGPLGNGTMPLWDLIGKFTGKPVYELLGGEGPKRVPVYDGSIYFTDLLPEFSGNYLDRFKEEIEMGLLTGHRTFKVKIGRGYKWMETEAGYDRDVEVLAFIRKSFGPDVAVGVDSNNGYDLARTKRLLTDLPECDFAFLEEMFPEQIDECLELKRFIADHGWKTLVADGETEWLDALKPFIEARAVDVFQGDMNWYGLEGILTEAAWAREQGLQVAPHNWGSLVGFYMELHVGRAIRNFYMAEQDPLSNDVLIADGYTIKEGTGSVPDAPGFGLRVDEKKFASSDAVRILFDLG
jgi:L-alanine-DL-glutamate epimerase-like enolase superfamily enzyme